jgi:hypothetical protein
MGPTLLKQSSLVPVTICGCFIACGRGEGITGILTCYQFSTISKSEMDRTVEF